MKKIIVTLFIVALGFAATIVACRHWNNMGRQAVHNPDEPGGKYLAALLMAIKNADVITISEHSDMIDYLTPDKPVEGYKEKIYEVVKISQTEKRGLIGLLNSLDTTTQNAFAACTFNPHHRIAFYKDGKLTGTLEVCFDCSQIEWSGSTQFPPWSIYGGLKAYVSGIGLHPTAEWWKMYVGKVAQGSH